MASSAQKLTTTNEHLPENLTLQILYYLSVKELLRFSCTSKRWWSIISDRQFAITHFKLASERNTLTQRLLLSSPSRLQSLDLQTSSWPYRRESLFTLHLHTPLDNSCISNRTCPFPKKSMKMLGSCNGMVCVAHDGYYIWNPSTSMLLKLPNPDFTPYEEFYILSQSTGEPEVRRHYLRLYSGFGYVSATDDYKFVLAASHTDGSTNLEIFSSRANAWKTMEPSDALPHSAKDKMAALSNEALHWATMTYHYECGIISYAYAIVTFDLANEEFGNMPLPLPLIEENEDGEIQIDAGVVLGGRLCVSAFYEINTHFKPVEVWVMMEYGVRESWTKLFQFKKLFTWYTFWRPVFHTDSSIVFWGRKPWLNRREDRLIRYNHAYEDVAAPSGISAIGRGVCGMIQYDETLLWLGDNIGVQESSKRLGTQQEASTSMDVDGVQENSKRLGTQQEASTSMDVDD